MAKSIDPAELSAAIAAVSGWLKKGAGDVDKPGRAQLARAVRLSARTLAQDAPGKSVELRIPPFVAVQCIEGPEHTRGTPPNVVETDPATWLLLATGRLSFDDALARNRVDASGSRAREVGRWLPVFPGADY